MDSFILIDGVSLWGILALLIFGAINYIFVANGYLKYARESERKDEIIKRLREDNNELLAAYLDAACGVDENV